MMRKEAASIHEFKLPAKSIFPIIFDQQDDMDTLDGTEWDVVIVGTGIAESLLALYAPLIITVETQAD